MTKQLTSRELLLEVKDIVTKGVQDMKHSIRTDKQKVIDPLSDDLHKISKNVVRIEETLKNRKEDKKEIMDSIDKYKGEVMGYAKSKFNVLWGVGSVLVLVMIFVINITQNNIEQLESMNDKLREEFAVLRQEQMYLRSNK